MEINKNLAEGIEIETSDIHFVFAIRKKEAKEKTNALCEFKFKGSVKDLLNILGDNNGNI